MKLYKITNDIELHSGLQYQTGLNIDPLPFNPAGSCLPGGIYYTTVEHICKFFHYGPWIREVTLPEDAQVYADPSGNKWKADKVILGERRLINSPEVFKELKEYILKSPDASYQHSYYAINRCRFELGEPIIATNAHFSYYYAAAIIKGRFELGEKAIATDAQYSYFYAKDILKGRFELGEPAIATHAHYSYYYADIIKGRFELGEKIIAADEYYSDLYKTYCKYNLRQKT